MNLKMAVSLHSQK